MRHGVNAGSKSIPFSIQSFIEFFLVHQYVFMISGFWLYPLRGSRQGEVETVPHWIKAPAMHFCWRFSMIGYYILIMKERNVLTIWWKWKKLYYISLIIMIAWKVHSSRRSSVRRYWQEWIPVYVPITLTDGFKPVTTKHHPPGILKNYMPSGDDGTGHYTDWFQHSHFHVITDF